MANNCDNTQTYRCSRSPEDLLHADYMDKMLLVRLAGHISLDGGVTYNLEQAADVLDKPMSEVKVVALDRKGTLNYSRN